jgi:hypothetical protein
MLYAPYARIMKKICWRAVPHPPRARRVPALVNGTEEQFGSCRRRRPLVEPLMHFHGNPIPPAEDPHVWRIKSQGTRRRASSSSRAMCADPRARTHDPRSGAPQGRRERSVAYTEPDREKLHAVVTGHGPASAERLAFRRLSREDVAWVERVMLAEAA